MKAKNKLKKTKKKNPGGRPEIKIDIAKVKRLSKFMYTDEELSAGLGVSIATFKRKKSEDPRIIAAMLEGQAIGKASLRRKQYTTAMKGNVALLKWLGTQYLAQKEKFIHGNDPVNPMPAAVTTVQQTTLTFASAEEAAAAFKAKLRGEG